MAGIAVYHNILWSKYKGVVFSELHSIANEHGIHIEFNQIAETENSRMQLGSTQAEYHKYPYKLYFNSSYEKINKFILCYTLLISVFRSKADVIVLPGYDKIEYWVMLFGVLMKRKVCAVFCDSTINDKEQKKLKGILKQLFFSKCAGVFCYGQRSAEYVRHYGVPQSNVYMRCQAAALPSLYQPERALEKRRSRAPEKGKPKFAYIGRLSTEKGIDDLIVAFANVLKVYPNSELEIYGDGPEKVQLQYLINRLEINSNAKLKGVLNSQEFEDLYTRITCLVLPSRSEPWGLVVNESLSYSCPVIVSSVCGCVPELVKDRITGLVVKPNLPHELARAMVEAVDLFSDITLTGRNCLETIAPFSPKNAAKAIFNGCESMYMQCKR